MHMGKEETIPAGQVDVLAAGFPCISLSPLTTTPAALNDASSSSGLGWKSIDQYVKRHRPKLVLLENVQTLFQSRKLDGGKKPSLGLNS